MLQKGVSAGGCCRGLDRNIGDQVIVMSFEITDGQMEIQRDSKQRDDIYICRFHASTLLCITSSMLLLRYAKLTKPCHGTLPQ